MISKGKSVSYISTLLMGVVYKFTASLPKLWYKRRITFKSEIKVAFTPPHPAILGNINNYKDIIHNSSVAGDKKLLIIQSF